EREVVCFFFQAEDGIRGFHVTGVQTCALPICREGRRRQVAAVEHADAYGGPLLPRLDQPALDGERADPGEDVPAVLTVAHLGSRSEERRVGRECRRGLQRSQNTE